MYLKDPYAQFEKYKTIKRSTYDKEDNILVIKLQEEIKDYSKRVIPQKNNISTVYGILCVQFTPGLQNVLPGDPNYDTNSDIYHFIWLMENIKLNSSGIADTSNPFHTECHALKWIFNLL